MPRLRVSSVPHAIILYVSAGLEGAVVEAKGSDFGETVVGFPARGWEAGKLKVTLSRDLPILIHVTPYRASTDLDRARSPCVGCEVRVIGVVFSTQAKSESATSNWGANSKMKRDGQR